MKVLGVDAAKGGWFTVSIEDNSVGIDLYEDMGELWEDHHEADRILVDIPIGLPKNERRECDELAKEHLGCRGLSVFYTPSRAVIGVDVDDYDRANEVNRNEQGHGLSKQAWNLMPKIRDVDDFLKEHDDSRNIIHESHPELCFYAFNDRNPIAYAKTSERGREKRRDVLANVVSDVDTIYEDARDRYLLKEVARDDIYDGMVLAAAARCDELTSLPEDPPTDKHEPPMEIVYPDPTTYD